MHHGNVQAELVLTGASGIVGSHILISLIANNISPRVLSRDIRRDSQHLQKLFAHYGMPMPEIRWVAGDIRHLGDMEDALEGAHAIIHAAGMVSTRSADFHVMHQVNVEGTANLVNLALDMGISWFGYISSVATLGPNPEGLVDEDYFWKPGKLTTAYAQSKYEAEQEVWRAFEEGLPVCILNPSVVLGPGSADRFSMRIFHRCRKGLPGFIEGSSGYVDARDVADAMVKAYMKELTGKRLIVSGTNATTSTLLEAIHKGWNMPMKVDAVQGWKLHAARGLEWVATKIQGKSAELSTDLIKMARSQNRYDASRSKQLLGLQYRSLEDAVANVQRYMA